MANTTEKLDEIYQQIQDHPNQLSTLLPRLYPIALEYEDYEGFCILNFWGKPLLDKEGNRSQYSEIEKILQAVGLDKEVIQRLEQDAFIKYMDMRHIEKDKVCSFSARELENYFVRVNNLIDALEVPKGLNPTDLYYKTEQVTTQKLKALSESQPLEKQYTVLQEFITTKLAYYKTLSSQKERRIKMEKKIKNSKKIFIIHGHNEAKRRELVTLLKERFHLEPVVLSDQPDQGLTIIEKFEKYAMECSYAFALFTPDDIVTNGGSRYFQARPNVIFELGWFYAYLGRSRVCILDQESEQSKIFSDLQGVMRKQFKENISERIPEIEMELKSVGIIS